MPRRPPSWVDVDLAALAANLRSIRARIGERRLVAAVVKADAYGHGLLPVARRCEAAGVDFLAVATLGEARALRRARIQVPILLQGPWERDQAWEVVRLGLTPYIWDLEHARALSGRASALGRRVTVHVKVDTGMGRWGVAYTDGVAFTRAILSLPALEVGGIASHFATADSDGVFAREQQARFDDVLSGLKREGIGPLLAHMANSAALVALPEAHYDMVRPGLLLYGLAPFADGRLGLDVEAALTWRSWIARVRDLPEGSSLGYGLSWTASRSSRVALVPVGYADGLRRSCSPGTAFLVRGQRAPVVGWVSMDSCFLDVTEIPGVKEGDEVVLIGRQAGGTITAHELACQMGTIPYEVVCGIASRVVRRYHG